MTHLKQDVVDAVFLYQFAIGYLIRNAEDPDRAKKAFAATHECCQAIGNEEIANWLVIAAVFANKKNWDRSILNPVENMGFLCYGFTLAFFGLLMQPEMAYEECMALACKLAGDTDTNACIAGGMLGAYLGRSNLAHDYVTTVLNCDISESAQDVRPTFV